MPGLTKRRRLGTKAKLSNPRPMAGEKAMTDEGGMKRPVKPVALSNLREGDTLRLIGRGFRISKMEPGRVVARDVLTQEERRFKPDMIVIPRQTGEDAARPLLSQ